jgi:hypothetical protein
MQQPPCVAYLSSLLPLLILIGLDLSLKPPPFNQLCIGEMVILLLQACARPRRPRSIRKREQYCIQDFDLATKHQLNPQKQRFRQSTVHYMQAILEQVPTCFPSPSRTPASTPALTGSMMPGHINQSQSILASSITARTSEAVSPGVLKAVLKEKAAPYLES